MNPRPGQENECASPSKRVYGRSASPSKHIPRRQQPAWFRPQPALFSDGIGEVDHADPRAFSIPGTPPPPPRSPTKPALGEKSNVSPAKPSRPPVHFDMKGNRVAEPSSTEVHPQAPSVHTMHSSETHETPHLPSPVKSTTKTRSRRAVTVAPPAPGLAEEWPEVEYMPPKPAPRTWDVPELNGLPLGDDLVGFIDSIRFCPPEKKRKNNDEPLVRSDAHFPQQNDYVQADRERYLGGKMDQLFPWGLELPNELLEEPDLTDDEEDTLRLAQLLAPEKDRGVRVPSLPTRLNRRSLASPSRSSTAKPGAVAGATTSASKGRQASRPLDPANRAQTSSIRPALAVSASTRSKVPAPGPSSKLRQRTLTTGAQSHQVRPSTATRAGTSTSTPNALSAARAAVPSGTTVPSVRVSRPVNAARAGKRSGRASLSSRLSVCAAVGARRLEVPEMRLPVDPAGAFF